MGLNIIWQILFFMLAYFPFKLPWSFKLIPGTYLLIQTDLSTEFYAADSDAGTSTNSRRVCARVF